MDSHGHWALACTRLTSTANTTTIILSRSHVPERMEWDRNGMGTEQFNPFAESKYSGTLLTSEITIHLTTMITEILCWENGGQGLLLPHLYQDGPESRKQIDSRETLKRWMINDLNMIQTDSWKHQDSMRFKKILTFSKSFLRRKPTELLNHRLSKHTPRADSFVQGLRWTVIEFHFV